MKFIFTCLLFCFSTYIFGQIDLNNDGGPYLSPISSGHFYCSKMQDHAGFDGFQNPNINNKISGCPTTFQDWAAFSDMALIENLQLYDDFECYRPLFNFDQQTGQTLFSPNNFVAACNKVSELLLSYTGEQNSGLYGLLNYLHAFVYHEFYQSSIKFEANEIEILTNTVINFVNHPNAHMETEAALKNLGKVYVLCDQDGIRSQPEVLSAFKKSLKLLTIDKTWEDYNSGQIYGSYLIGYSIIYATYRGVAFNDIEFTNALSIDTNFVPLFANLITVIEFDNKHYYKDFPRLAMTELIRMCSVPLLEEKTIDAFVNIANNRPSTSSYWYRSVVAINMKGKCEEYNLCFDIDELRAEVLNRLFPKEYIYEDGKIQINTPLAESTVQRLYYAALQVQAQFYRLIESDTPLKDDPSDTLKIIIYGSKSEYEEWQYELFGLNTNNGGIYIEKESTFYSYERTKQESIYTLEELFRHEYTHYLIGRYIDPFFWGETIFYTNEQLTWFNEGLAEYLAGSSRLEKIKTRKSIATALGSDINKMSPSAIISSKYNQGFTFYRYACAFISYLIDEKPTLFNEITNSIKSYSINQFNAAISEINNDNTINPDFMTYLDDYTSDPSSWWDPISDTIDINSLQFKNLSEINNYVDDQAWIDFLIEQSATFSLERFRLIIDGDKAVCEIDQCLKDLGNEDNENNFYHAVGYYKEENGQLQYVITGPLNSGMVNVNEQQINQTLVSVFPNPAHKHIDVNARTSIDKVVLISIDGRVVEALSVRISDNRIIVNIDHLNSGLYHVLVIDKKGKSHHASFVKHN